MSNAADGISERGDIPVKRLTRRVASRHVLIIGKRKQQRYTDDLGSLRVFDLAGPILSRELLSGHAKVLTRLPIEQLRTFTSGDMSNPGPLTPGKA